MVNVSSEGIQINFGPAAIYAEESFEVWASEKIALRKSGGKE